LEKYQGKTGGWLRADGPQSDIVISSRVRLARNIKDIPFSLGASEEDLKQVVELFQQAFPKSMYLANADFLELKEISELDQLFLAERHLISHELSRSQYGCVAIGDKEMVGIMINEEDHLRLQVMVSGLQPLPAWQILDRIDDELAHNLEYAVSPRWGYLTACPTNVGTGMRASVMLHLPALVLTEQIKKMPKAIAQLGLAIRGFYGEGTSSLGDFFQISNQITLGQKEEEIVDNIEKIVSQIVEHERKAEQILFKRNPLKIKDRIHRAYGVLLNARLISSNEAMNLLSSLRLGIRMKILEGIGFDVLNELIIIIQPAHIQKWAGKILNEEERDAVRADIIRRKIAN